MPLQISVMLKNASEFAIWGFCEQLVCFLNCDVIIRVICSTCVEKQIHLTIYDIWKCQLFYLYIIYTLYNMFSVCII